MGSEHGPGAAHPAPSKESYEEQDPQAGGRLQNRAGTTAEREPLAASHSREATMVTVTWALGAGPSPHPLGETKSRWGRGTKTKE